METLFLDTETTGLHPPKDKVVEIAIADLDGNVLLDTLVNPEREIGFATTIHHITDGMVATSPTLEQLLPQIQAIVRDNHLIIYNAQFDTGFFPDKLKCAKTVSCAMLRFAKIYGQKKYGSYTWQKLTTAADYIDYTWEGEAHRALADVQATCALWKWMERQSRDSNDVDDPHIIDCPHCSTKNRISKSGIGKIAKCGKCGGYLLEAE
jgi:DNA polymerase III subunit epsilon